MPILHLKSQSEVVKEVQFSPRKPLFQLLIIIFILILALSIRLYHVNEPPLDFQIMKQYHHAHIARGYYFETLTSIPEWRKQVARINLQRQELLEPRILEHMVFYAYRIVGGELLWIPRVLSSVFWLIGGVFLYLIAMKITSPDSALVSTAFYLFLPFGITVSRSFQPDPMMVMMLLFSIFKILRYHEQPTIPRFLLAAAVSGLAMFVKPLCIFIIFGVFFSLTIHKKSFWKSLINKNLLIFAVVSLLPTTIYYVYGILSDVGYLREQANRSFFPQLLISPYFWKDWFIMIVSRIGLIPFVAALLGLLMFKKGLPRSLLAGLWAGYFVFGLVFNFHIYTHDYYQLQFIPVVALSIGPIGAMLMNRLIYHRGLVTVLVILILAATFTIGLNIRRVQFESVYTEYKNQFKVLGAIFGVNPQFKKFLTDDFKREIRIAREIGEIVEHSSKTLFLDPHYGESITYHGELSGYGWPRSIDIKNRRLRGLLREPGIEESCKFENGYTISCKLYYMPHLEKYSPEYFIVIDLQDFEKQIDLKNFLVRNFIKITENDKYLIFDLRKRVDLK